MPHHRKRAPEGIEVRHKASCRSRAGGGRCDCTPGYRAVIRDAAGKKVTRTFANVHEARSWRAQKLVQLRAGTLRAPVAVTLNAAADQLIAGMRDGTVRNRKGDPYKPAAIRSYERGLRLRVLPALGAKSLSSIRRRDLVDLIDRMAADGLDGSTIRNTLDPVRVIYRRALDREQVAVSPCTNLPIPAPRGQRDRIASPGEAVRLLAALPSEDRPLWATALYAGLRRGELRALRWRDVDLDDGVIRVERGWDDQEGEIEGKTKAARRTVPIASALRRYLVEQRLASGGAPEAFVFGSSAEHPFEPSTVRRRALTAWSSANDDAKEKAAEAGKEVDRAELLQPIALHEARHTFASLMIAAGVNAKALSSYMGHASVSITFDRYGHLMPGSEAEAADLLDAYLTRAAGS